MTIRVLVLSGGGGRGAFHAGVYKYLSQLEKPGLDDDHQGAWMPDIVVGTSIGAVNGAAIAQGISAEKLEQFWLSLREDDVQGLPPSMNFFARRVMNWVLKRSIGVRLPQVPAEIAMSPTAAEAWPPIPGLPKWLGDRLFGRWSNLLDTGPLYQTLEKRLGLQPDQIMKTDTTLLINATNIRTGEGVIFSNRELRKRTTGLLRPDLRPGITIKRIIASCSIPLVYPWTQDDDGELYWDGALVANTPLGAAFDAVSDRPMSEPMEVVTVLLNPWWQSSDLELPQHQQLPQDFAEAATWTLDWTMLASFRVSLKMLYAFNKLAQRELAAGETQTYRIVTPVMVAPQEFLPVARIIDYDEPASRDLIQLGHAAAEAAFRATFAPSLK